MGAIVFVPVVSRLAGKSPRQMEAVKKRNCAHDPERAIEQPPGERNLPDLSANEGERNDGRAGNQPAAQDPGVTNRIPKRPDEKQGDDEMPERKPIGPITDKRKCSVGSFQTEEDKGNPRPKPESVS